MKSNESRLKAELSQAGAKPAEIKPLLAVASGLQAIRRTGATKSPPTFLVRFLPFGLTGAACLVVGAWLIVFSQPVMPGSLLFPVQKLSDAAAIDIHPAYRGTIMMKRAQQVRLLTAGHAADSQVLAAVSDYQSVAAGYGFSSSNYDVLEYCRSNLTQAAITAEGAARQSIQRSLASLPSA